MPRRLYSHALKLVALIVVTQLAACGGDDKQVKKAATWLKDYSQMNPPHGDWVTTHVETDGNDKVVMDVLVPSKQQVNQIKSRTRIEQSIIVELACPPKDAEIWTILDKDKNLWVNLTARTSNGLTETLVGASCKR